MPSSPPPHRLTASHFSTSRHRPPTTVTTASSGAAAVSAAGRLLTNLPVSSQLDSSVPLPAAGMLPVVYHQVILYYSHSVYNDMSLYNIRLCCSDSSNAEHKNGCQHCSSNVSKSNSYFIPPSYCCASFLLQEYSAPILRENHTFPMQVFRRIHERLLLRNVIRPEQVLLRIEQCLSALSNRATEPLTLP